jgi:hypothetical protein
MLIELLERRVPKDCASREQATLHAAREIRGDDE